MIFLFLASVAGVAYAIERFVNLRARSFVPSGMAEQADELWRGGKFDEIEALADRSNSTLARVLAVIARHRRSSMADVSMMAGDVASRDLRRHLQKAYPLAIVATVSPLLGLFGTVIGMIGAFDKVSAAGSLGDASLLGGDIAKALITTAAGLSIAIPTLGLLPLLQEPHQPVRPADRGRGGRADQRVVQPRRPRARVGAAGGERQ